MGKQKNRRYTLEFKQQAAELASRVGTTKAARQLGVPMQTMHSWKRAAVKKDKESKGELDGGFQEENKRLRKEVEELKKVNEILRRAAAFFSQAHLK